MPLKVDGIRCPQNHACPLVKECPAEAIHQEGFGLPWVDAELCQKCGLCVRSCPMKAFQKVEPGV
ncbi:MAG: 4Fe-4S binding protein [Alistipes sp.]|nr:4Fe-4S binding protein [Alistipes sp.]